MSFSDGDWDSDEVDVEIPGFSPSPGRYETSRGGGHDDRVIIIDADSDRSGPIVTRPGAHVYYYSDTNTYPHGGYSTKASTTSPTRVSAAATQHSDRQSTQLFYYDDDPGYDSSDDIPRLKKALSRGKKSSQSAKSKHKKKKEETPEQLEERRSRFHRGASYSRARYPVQYHDSTPASGTVKGKGATITLPPSFCPQTRYGREARLLSARERSCHRKKWPQPPVYPPREKFKDVASECEILHLVDTMDLGTQCTPDTYDFGVQCPLFTSEASTQYPRTKRRETSTQSVETETSNKAVQNVPETTNTMTDACYRIVQCDRTFVVTDDIGIQAGESQTDGTSVKQREQTEGQQAQLQQMPIPTTETNLQQPQPNTQSPEQQQYHLHQQQQHLQQQHQQQLHQQIQNPSAMYGLPFQPSPQHYYQPQFAALQYDPNNPFSQSLADSPLRQGLPVIQGPQNQPNQAHPGMYGHAYSAPAGSNKSSACSSTTSMSSAGRPPITRHASLPDIDYDTKSQTSEVRYQLTDAHAMPTPERRHRHPKTMHHRGSTPIIQWEDESSPKRLHYKPPLAPGGKMAPPAHGVKSRTGSESDNGNGSAYSSEWDSESDDGMGHPKISVPVREDAHD